MGLAGSEQNTIMCCRFGRVREINKKMDGQTDRHTDRRTDDSACGITEG